MVSSLVWRSDKGQVISVMGIGTMWGPTKDVTTSGSGGGNAVNCCMYTCNPTYTPLHYSVQSRTPMRNKLC